MLKNFCSIRYISRNLNARIDFSERCIITMEKLEVVDVVEKICKHLIEHGFQPQVVETKWYDIWYHSSSMELMTHELFQTIRRIAGDYFGECYWAHSIQHVYIWFQKKKKVKKEDE